VKNHCLFVCICRGFTSNGNVFWNERMIPGTDCVFSCWRPFLLLCRSLIYSRPHIPIHILIRAFRYSFLVRTPASIYLAYTSSQTNVDRRNCCLNLESRRNSTEAHENKWEAKDKSNLTVVII